MKELNHFLIALLLLVVSCNGSKEPYDGPASSFNVSGVVLPSTLDCVAGETLSFRILGGHGPVATDQVELSGEETFVMPVSEAGENAFSFVLPQNAFSGKFVFSVIREGKAKRVGNITLFVTSADPLEPGDATVYGKVSAAGRGLPGVSVSDGTLVVQTDENGVYRMVSKKKQGLVFVSVPSGYEAISVGAQPRIHSLLEKAAGEAERKDFSLVRKEGLESSATVLMMGDIHLANRSTKDRSQFAAFVADVNAFTAAASGPVYGVTLGDMTWDLYWLVNKYSFPEYMREVSTFRNLSLFHTIGNHDHSMYYTGDFDTVQDYKRYVAPTYFSFNLAGVHFVVLDDVECTNSTPSQDDAGNPCYVREYSANLVSGELTWLENDLAFVSADTPLVIMMHIPLCNEDGSVRLPSANVEKLEAIFAQHPNTHLFTGHTHRMYNIDRLSTKKYFEHNAGAVCGTWWWSASETPGVNIGQDGSPGGYTVLKLAGGNLTWQYKATGWPLDHQFVTYDRNMIHLTAEKYVSSGTATYKAAFDPGMWKTASDANEIYVNVWNWDPAWKVEMLEGETSLEVSRVTNVKDPLHLIAYTAKRLNKNSDAGFATVATSHMFRAVASSPTSTVTVRVTDRFGNVYTQTMNRPKNFDTATYAE